MKNVLGQIIEDKYAIYNADCVDVISDIPDESLDFTIYSPPFQSLYVFSDSDRDMSNCTSGDQFAEHYQFLINEHYRTTKPGRLVSVHCVNLPTTINRDGFIGIHDFRGDIIRQFQKAGFIFHSEVTIWKDPVVSMQRTKAIGLLHKQLKKDSSLSRQGIPDYLITFRKPGQNETPIAGLFDRDKYAGETPPEKALEYGTDDHGNRFLRTDEDLKTWDSTMVWQNYASPVWMDINQGQVLKYRDAKDDDDEKHISPLQLQVIERALQLWSLPGETVFSPFMGIGSEGYVSVKNDRKFIGAELKSSYYSLACSNMEQAILESNQVDLFSQ